MSDRYLTMMVCALGLVWLGCESPNGGSADARTATDLSSGVSTTPTADAVQTVPGGADVGTPATSTATQSGSVVDLCKLQWTETLPQKPSLADVQTAFTAATWYESATAVLGRVLPFAASIVASQGKEKMVQWFEDTTSWTGVLDGITTAVHEGIHFYSGDHSQNGQSVYPVGVNSDVTITEWDLPPRKSIQKYVDGSQANNDKYELYFTTKDYAEMPEQSFWTTLDEFNAYTTDELLGMLLNAHHSINGFNCGQGLASFMYFTQLSLKAARLDAAAQYGALLADKTAVKGILTLWSRAAWVWSMAKGFSDNPVCQYVSADKTALNALIIAPENHGEIERLRDAYCN